LRAGQRREHETEMANLRLQAAAVAPAIKRAALAVVFVMLAPTLAASQNRPRTIVALLAHADDETAVAPALARYVREGVQVQMIIVTDGAGGNGTQTYLQRPDSGPVGDVLAKARADEARCAATTL